MTTLLIEEISSESDKAVQVVIGARRRQNGEMRNVQFWLPKSQIKINGTQVECPDWLVEQKIEWVGNQYDFDCDGLMSIGLDGSTAPTAEEADADWQKFMDHFVTLKAKKEKKAKKN